VITGYHEKFLVLEENFHHRLDKWWRGFQTCFWNDAACQNTPYGTMGFAIILT